MHANRGQPILCIATSALQDTLPDPSLALVEPDGLLAAGGDLSPERLLDAYWRGIFPWYSDDQPILWWAPNPRAVMLPGEIKVSRSLRKTLRNGGFEISMDRAFGAVIAACAAPRAGSEGTWITDDMSAAYTALHQRGIAHSVECWRDGKLAGGLYGLAIGRVFFGESMFARERDASKVALCTLAERLLDWDYELIDCQVGNDHLRRLGAMDMRRTEFNETLARLCALEPAAGAWSE